MTPAIFISYSRQDEKQALHLLNLLRNEGYTVWIDQESIAGASIWSDEIVQNIKQSTVFIALLSAHSAESHNVSKEIALAAENRKVILPIEIGQITLPGQLEYALAGIQRTNYHDEEAILHAVKNQVARLAGESSDSQTTLASPRLRKLRFRKRVLVGVGAFLIAAGGLFFLLRHPKASSGITNNIVVLPFTTLNLELDSTRNLDVFSENIQSELSKMKDLTVTSYDIASTYKNSRLNALAIGTDLAARFVVEGTVRKSHDVSFISTRLYDTKRGGQIWEQNYSCNAKELFTIRAKVSTDIFGNLFAIISSERELAEAEEYLKMHPNDPAAYAKLGARLMTTDKTRAHELLEKAIRMDSDNVAYVITAGIAATRQGEIGLAREKGKQAVALCRKQLYLHPDSIQLATNYALALDMADETALAERTFDSLMRVKPNDVRILYNAACCYAKQGKADRAIDILLSLYPIAPGKRWEVQSDPDFDNIRSNPRYARMYEGVAR
jgi:TolB-like protein